MKKAGLLGTIGAALALFAIGTPAHAATTVGSSPPPPPPENSPFVSCGTFSVDVDTVQIATAPGVNPYTVPAGGGVITSWQTTTIGYGTVRLRVFDASSNAASVTATGESDRLTLGLTPPPSAPTRISVAGGEKLGLGINSSVAADCLNPSDNPANQGAIAGSAPVGQPSATISGGVGGPLPALLSVSAVVEPDADKDGYGDETQDQCPGVTDLPDGICLSLGLGKPKLNAKNGTATIAATVPGTGVLTLKGKNIAQQVVRVDAAGTSTLAVKPKGRIKRKLARGGKATVPVAVTFTPAAGRSIEETAKVKLKQKVEKKD